MGFTNQWVEKTWGEGITLTKGENIWSDGDNIYYSNDITHYILDKLTGIWTIKIWNGISHLYGENVWTDGDNIYYSASGENNYILNKSTSTWETKTWYGLTQFYGRNVWTDGNNIYYSQRSDQYILNKSTSTWEAKTWNGLSSSELSDFAGEDVWTDGENIYWSGGSTSYQYIYNKNTNDWERQNWTWEIHPNYNYGEHIWTDGENIYFSYKNVDGVLDKTTSTWKSKIWDKPANTLWTGKSVWTDGENIYYSNDGNQAILKKTNSPIITTPSTDLGDKIAGFSFDYSITDTDASDTITANIKLDGNTVVSDYTVDQTQTYTCTLSNSSFNSLALGTHTYTITATDSEDNTTTENIVFSKVSKEEKYSSKENLIPIIQKIEVKLENRYTKDEVDDLLENIKPSVDSITKAQINELFKHPGIIVLSKDNISINAGETDTITFSEATGAVTVSSADETIATASLSGNTITVSGVAEGNTNINVNVAETNEYKAISKIINATINEILSGWYELSDQMGDGTTFYASFSSLFTDGNDLYGGQSYKLYKYDVTTNIWNLIATDTNSGAHWIIYNGIIYHYTGSRLRKFSEGSFETVVNYREEEKIGNITYGVDKFDYHCIIYNNYLYLGATCRPYEYNSDTGERIEKTDYGKFYYYGPNGETGEIDAPTSFGTYVSFIYNNKLYYNAGNSNDNAFYYYDGSSWTKVPTPSPLSNSFFRSAIPYNNYINIIGCFDYKNKCYIWDGVSSSFTEVKDLPFSTYNVSSIVFKNQLHLLDADNQKHRYYIE